MRAMDGWFSRQDGGRPFRCGSVFYPWLSAVAASYMGLRLISSFLSGFPYSLEEMSAKARLERAERFPLP